MPSQVPQVTELDIIKHFVNHVKSDNLGQISTWLIANADKKGIRSPECLKLAQKHSMAVDFAKTGVPVEFNDIKELVRSIHSIGNELLLDWGVNIICNIKNITRTDRGFMYRGCLS